MKKNDTDEKLLFSNWKIYPRDVYSGQLHGSK